jgi:hypothetical protein
MPGTLREGVCGSGNEPRRCRSSPVQWVLLKNLSDGFRAERVVEVVTSSTRRPSSAGRYGRTAAAAEAIAVTALTHSGGAVP